MTATDAHLRTLQYTGGLKPKIPAGITVGRATAETRVGQVAALTAANILARSHPEVVLHIPAVELIVDSPLGGSTLAEACDAVASAAGYETGVTTVDALPEAILSVGIGPDAAHASIYAGARGWTASTGHAPQPLDQVDSSTIGLGTAVTLATGWMFRTAVQLPAIAERSFSLWSLMIATDRTGPTALPTIDVGRVWMVGAGAVGSCLAWWLRLLGVTGDWMIIDKDIVDLTNINRSLGMFLRDWGEPDKPTYKADVAATLVPGARPFVGWWDEWTEHDEPSPDVLLPVANERGVRAQIAAYSHPATLHATTSRDWTGELHRHLAAEDGCIACRFPETAPTLKCATGPVQIKPGDPARDASLPFLSGAAGLMLAGALIQLQEGTWSEHDHNGWRLWCDDTPRVVSRSRWHCTAGCAALSQQGVRRLMHGHTRWFALDGAKEAA